MSHRSRQRPALPTLHLAAWSVAFFAATSAAAPVKKHSRAQMPPSISSGSVSLPVPQAGNPSVPAAKETAAAKLEVPKGTVLAIETVDEVTTAKNKAGDMFRARINEGVWVHGRVAIPPGTTVHGFVTDAIPSGRVKGQAKLALTLGSVEMDGHSYAVQSDTLTYLGEPHTGKHIGSWLGGALQGALYGVLFGGKQGAILGAGAGAAAGTAASVLTGKLDVDFPQGSKLMFETQEPIFVPEPPAAPPAPPQNAGAAKPEEKPQPAPEKAPAKEAKETRPSS